MTIDYERVRDLFDYRNGNLYWKNNRLGTNGTDVRAGSPDIHGHININVNGRLYKAHRLVWLWHNKTFPTKDIDHINQIPYDNRIENLRESSKSLNSINRGNAANSKTVRGVSLRKVVKWRARIKINNKEYSLGEYDDFYEAVLARLSAEQCLGWDKLNKSSPAYEYAIHHGLYKPPAV